MGGRGGGCGLFNSREPPGGIVVVVCDIVVCDSCDRSYSKVPPRLEKLLPTWYKPATVHVL